MSEFRTEIPDALIYSSEDLAQLRGELAASQAEVEAHQERYTRLVEQSLRDVAEAREETRAGIATQFDATYTAKSWDSVRNWLRATPLGPTPLRERITELEAMSLRQAEMATAQAKAAESERDALKARVAELEGKLEDSDGAGIEMAGRAEAAEARAKEAEEKATQFSRTISVQDDALKEALTAKDNAYALYWASLAAVPAPDAEPKQDVIDKNSRAYRNGLEDGKVELMAVAERVRDAVKASVVLCEAGPESSIEWETVDLAALLSEGTK